MLQATYCMAGLPLLNVGRQYFASGAITKLTPADTEASCWQDQLEGPSTSGTLRLEVDSSSLMTCAGTNVCVRRA